jgi:hypothetical protein
VLRIAWSTRSRVSGAIRTSASSRPFSTSETVAWLTPVIRAMSCCVTRLRVAVTALPFGYEGNTH